VVVGRRNARRYGRDERFRGDLARLLAPAGTIWVDDASPVTGSPAPEGPLGFGLAPRKGEARAAVPAGDELAKAYLEQRGLADGAPGPLPKLLDALRRGPSRATASPPTWRSGQLWARAPDGPPAYLRGLARASGVDLDGFRWCLAAPGRYSSRKVLVFLFEGRDAGPTYITKLVRDPALNSRLENEAQALRTLASCELPPTATLPRVAFAGRHAGLAIVGETVVDGVPFRSEPLAAPGGPAVRSAIGWFHALAQVAPGRRATGGEVADTLAELLDRLRRIYRLAPAHQRYLEDQLESLRSIEAIPVVFQHGDPGPWNLLVTPDGRTSLLDWEAAEEAGAPLWDLLYFLRSHSIDHARAGGVRSAMEGFERQFLADTPVSRLVIEAVEGYRDAIGLPAQAVEPLFHTCWLHRALKEATRLAPEDLDGGHYVNLLRRCIDRAEEAATLRRLFGR
jgi:aminoglycoside phosphotransferase (APT) family kinase protein